MTNNNTLKILLILAGLIFMSGVAFLGVEYFNQDTKITVQEVKISELTNELLEVENDLNNLEIIYNDRDKEIQLTNELLTQSYARVKNYEEKIGQYEREIVRLKREGKLDKSKIQELETLLARFKSNLTDTYKKELDRVFKDNQRLGLLLDTLIEKDQQRRIEFNKQRVALLQRNDSLEQVIAQMKGITTAVQTPDVANFTFFNVDPSTGKSERGLSFKKAQLKVLRVEFDLLGKFLAESKIYNLYMIITDPDGFVISNPEEEYGGSVTIQGAKKMVSGETAVDYKKNTITVPIEFKPSLDDPWKSGTYKVSILYKGDDLGHDTFYVN